MTEDTIDLSKIVLGDVSTLIVKFKKLDRHATLPIQTAGNAGMDMTALRVEHTDMYTEYDTGIAAEIPEGYVGLLFPRSSISKYDLVLANSVGVIDSSYRGSLRFRYKTGKKNPKIYTIGDKIGQLLILPYPNITIVEVNELSSTDRAEGGFGSTGS